jgi:hypothetical protein
MSRTRGIWQEFWFYSGLQTVIGNETKRKYEQESYVRTEFA